MGDRCPLCGEPLPPAPDDPGAEEGEGEGDEQDVFPCDLLESRICAACCHTIVAAGEGDLGAIGHALGGGHPRERIAAWAREACAACPYGPDAEKGGLGAIDRREARAKARGKRTADHEIEREKARKRAARRARRRGG
ncbi:MAG: hypothetical protein JXP34_26660 [Planctomycetes bacterium]|nr:hypothetical protein [Planctomycetota bacterium]